MDKRKLIACLIFIIVFTSVFSQKKFSTEFVLQPGTSFIAGPWRNNFAYNAPPFKRNLTPALEAGANVIFNFKGKAGGKVGYDQAMKSGFYFADKIAFRIGLFYSMQGQGYKSMTQSDVTWSRKLRLHYLKVPLMFDFLKGKNEEKQFIYSAGFYAGYLTWYKEITTTSNPVYELTVITKNTTIDTTATGNISSQYTLKSKPYESLDYGMILGIGMQMKIATGLFLQYKVSGQIGFANIINSDAQYSSGTNPSPYFKNDVNTKTTHENLSVGFLVGLKKTFEWIPGAKNEKKRWRIFRFKE